MSSKPTETMESMRKQKKKHFPDRHLIVKMCEANDPIERGHTFLGRVSEYIRNANRSEIVDEPYFEETFPS
jgi:hypothetical protein